MATSETFLAWAESLESLSYYAILRVNEDATLEQIKAAFHSLALRCHPDRYVEEDPEVAAAAAKVFKRSVEAYNVLSKDVLRARYAKCLAEGQLRMDVNAVPKPKERPVVRTLEMIAQTPEAKAFAKKADRLLAIGKIEEARVQLVSAYQNDPWNDELKERLSLLYQGIAGESL